MWRGVRPFTTGSSAALGERLDGLVGARPDDEGVQVAREDPRRIARSTRRARAATRRLAGQAGGRRARRPRPRRRPGSASRASRIQAPPSAPRADRGADGGPPTRLQLDRAVEQGRSSAALSSSPVMKCRVKRGMLGAVRVRALTWNLFHGRDFPPDPALFTWRSRLTRLPERDATHIQVNHDLLRRVRRAPRRRRLGRRAPTGMPAALGRPLAVACQAAAHRVLTSRNWLLPFTSAIARGTPTSSRPGRAGRTSRSSAEGRQIVERAIARPCASAPSAG